MQDLFDLTDKVAIVTGGNGGIGRAIALSLAQHGADIVVAARNEQKTATVVAEVEALGRRCIGVRCDVLRHDDISATVDTAVRELGGVNILVNNAGVGHGGQPTQSVALDTWQRVIDINLTSVFVFCQAVYPALVKAGGGKIINVAGLERQFGKHGAHALGHVLAHRLATLDVGVHAAEIAVRAAVQQIPQRQQRRGLAGLPRRVQHEVLFVPDQSEHRVEIDPFQRRDAVVVRGHYGTCGVELAHGRHGRIVAEHDAAVIRGVKRASTRSRGHRRGQSSESAGSSSARSPEVGVAVALRSRPQPNRTRDMRCRRQSTRARQSGSAFPVILSIIPAGKTSRSAVYFDTRSKFSNLIIELMPA